MGVKGEPIITHFILHYQLLCCSQINIPMYQDFFFLKKFLKRKIILRVLTLMLTKLPWLICSYLLNTCAAYGAGNTSYILNLLLCRQLFKLTCQSQGSKTSRYSDARDEQPAGDTVRRRTPLNLGIHNKVLIQKVLRL